MRTATLFTREHLSILTKEELEALKGTMRKLSAFDGHAVISLEDKIENGLRGNTIGRDPNCYGECYFRISNAWTDKVAENLMSHSGGKSLALRRRLEFNFLVSVILYIVESMDFMQQLKAVFNRHSNPSPSGEGS